MTLAVKVALNLNTTNHFNFESIYKCFEFGLVQ